MKSVKDSGDNAEPREAIASRPQKSEQNTSEGFPTDASGEIHYLERAALSAAGQWGRVKEMPNGCWEWVGARTEGGYGAIRITTGNLWTVHRLIVTIFNRPMKDGEMACHSCDNPPCCNPSHLFIGTAGDNSNDSRQKGRRIGRAKVILTRRIADEIRAEYAAGTTRQTIANKRGINVRTVGSVIEGRTWTKTGQPGRPRKDSTPTNPAPLEPRGE